MAIKKVNQNTCATQGKSAVSKLSGEIHARLRHTVFVALMLLTTLVGIAHSQSNDYLDPSAETFTDRSSAMADGVMRIEKFRSALVDLNLAHQQVMPQFVKIRATVDQVAEAVNVERELLLAVIYMESRFRTDARSDAGAIGLMQVLPSTAEHFGLKAKDGKSVEERLLDPYTNLFIGAKIIAYLKSRFPERPDLVLAAYHAGEGAVMRYGRNIPNYPSTRIYVREIAKLYALLKTNAPGLDALG